MLDGLLTATGIQLEAKRFDLECAIHRCSLCECMDELDWLDRDGMILFLIATEAKPGDPAWTHVESLLSETLPIPSAK